MFLRTQVSKRSWRRWGEANRPRFSDMTTWCRQQIVEASIWTSGSVMVLGPWASSVPDLQPRLESLSSDVKRLGWGWGPPSSSLTSAALFFIGDRPRAWSVKLSRCSDLTAQNQQHLQRLNQFQPITIWSSEPSIRFRLFRILCNSMYRKWG